MNTLAAPAAPTVGREQSCGQCGATYRARRATSRFCSVRCRQRTHHGRTGNSPERTHMLHQWLLRRGFAGKIGPVNGKDPRPAVFGMTVPRAHALVELNGAIQSLRRSCPDLRTVDPVTEAEFVGVLMALAILDYDQVPVRKGRR